MGKQVRLRQKSERVPRYDQFLINILLFTITDYVYSSIKIIWNAVIETTF